MSSVVWLIGALAAGAAAFVVAVPAWRNHQARQRRDLNAERYLAWRGRAGERPQDERLTTSDRSRLAVAGALALVAVFCLVGFFTYA
ncbi:MAG: hypothetical protein H0W81_08890 [Chloroflexi bacterium]|nr:hypothetical protein [Chloroflexota bacterium]